MGPPGVTRFRVCVELAHDDNNNNNNTYYNICILYTRSPIISYIYIRIRDCYVTR